MNLFTCSPLYQSHAVGRRRQPRGRLRPVVAFRHDHDDQLLVAVAVVLVAADEVVRYGPERVKVNTVLPSAKVSIGEFVSHAS
jgi:hypothetical protein